MGESSGMEVMLSAIAPPIEDDFLWQFAENQGPSIKEEVLDSAAQSPSSSLFDDFDESSSSSPSFQCDSGCSSLSSFDIMMNMLHDPTTTSLNPTSEERTIPTRKNVVVKRRTRECSMICWLFRTLLTSEYRALPLNAVYEVFEETLHNQSNGHGRHYRQSIRHCLMTSAVFVRVLTPNPRKDFLVMNEQGSWWTVHPDCEMECAEQVFRTGTAHRCPPTASIPAYFSRVRMEEGKMSTNCGAGGGGGSMLRKSSATSSECSSSSSSAASSPTTSMTRGFKRFDPIRRVSYANGIDTRPTPTYRRFTGGFIEKQQQQQQPKIVNQQELLNPRSILLNDIVIDHEEVI